MELFASTEVVEQLQAELDRTAVAANWHDPGNLPLKLALAWQLRQRDCQRALQLADEVEQACHTATAAQQGETAIQAMLLRVALIRGEVKWLFDQFEAGKALAQTALQGFAAQGDALGCADAHWLLSWLAVDQGELGTTHAELNAMARHSAQHDPVRFGIAHAALARLDAFRDMHAAHARWENYLLWCDANAAGASDPSPVAALLCWREDFLGILAKRGSDYVNGIGHLSQTWHHGLASGQIRRAMNAATNIGDAFNNLNDYHTALEWMQRGLQLARQKGWPNNIAIALIQTAETLRRLQRHDSAHELLREALALMAGVAQSRNYAIALRYLGDVELARKQYASALHIFELLEQRASALAQADLQDDAKQGQAEALLELGQPQAALLAAQAALAGVKANADDQIAALRIMAAIHSRHLMPRPAHMLAVNAPMHYLQQALHLAHSIKNNIVPGDLLDSLAQEYAKLGDHQKAWDFSQQAAVSREKTHSHDAGNRANAMQLSHRTEQAQAEAEHQRQLAAAETRRAEALQQTSATLAQLATIGQEITACLQSERVFQVLHNHAQHLLEVDSLAIWLLDASAEALELCFGIEEGKPLPATRNLLSDPMSFTARCVREGREILIDYDPDQHDESTIPGTRTTASNLFAPLCRGPHILGVITIQAFQRHAYGEREQLIFRTLCAWTAIALSNANAHRQLAENQQQMLLQEKMAGLGTLTAGMAHEINNPTNFVHVAAQNQRVNLAEFQDFVTRLIDADADSQVVHEFGQRFAALNQNVGNMLQGTGRIRAIVNDLRAFTRLDENTKKTVRLSSCLTTTLNLVRTSWIGKVEFITEFTHDPEIECWPALLNQVFMGLLVGGCQAIAAMQAQAASAGLAAPAGKLTLRLRQAAGSLLIEFDDNGNKADNDAENEGGNSGGSGGSGGNSANSRGMSLPVAAGIVEKHGGKLNWIKKPGQGSCFTIALPVP